ncbi:hypothetical protein OIDMADRAFT_45810 [Oidiodendron maius Zn]|uniref:HAD-like protein n=1 Tax=Oidiodendron maius (strain Zn) TaxID=913774 RepID=A0A0C3CXQ9_OIDMZ|nr:hypothetical protein OIDMADRAFT_45810 [Oidiodendron maius Zn]
MPGALILDLGGVFYTFSDVPDAPIPSKQFKFLLDSSEWHDLESGKMSENEAFKAITERLSLAEGDIEGTLRLVSATLKLNDGLVAAIRQLKDDSDGRLRVFAASNISQDRYNVLRSNLQGWDIFDGIFISASLGVRKPERAFYDRLLEAASLTAESTVFIDNRTENVIGAQCCGMHGVLFDSTNSVVRKLLALFDNPIQRGNAWLHAHARNMWCMTNTGVEVREMFQQLFILYLTNDWNLVDIRQLDSPTGRWNMWAYGPPQLTTESYPDDLDTTTLALLQLDVSVDLKHKAMDGMLQFLNPDGLFYCYFDSSRPRVDPFISANALRLFYANGRGFQLVAALHFMKDMLRTGAFEHGTRDLCVKNPSAKELGDLDSLIRQRLQERMGCTQDAPSAAFRLIASNNLRMRNSKDEKILLDSQHVDGRWTGYVYRYGSSGVLFGSDGLTTALAVAALQGAKQGVKKHL